MKKYCTLLFLCIFIIMCAGCRKDNVIEFDNTYSLSLAPDVLWAVVLEPYAAFRKENGWNAEINGHCRKADIMQILGKSISENNEVWYEFENGWLPGSSVSVYNNRFRAVTAASNLGR